MRTLYFHSVVSSSFFLASSQWSQSGCLPYFTHGVALVRDEKLTGSGLCSSFYKFTFSIKDASKEISQCFNCQESVQAGPWGC